MADAIVPGSSIGMFSMRGAVGNTRPRTIDATGSNAPGDRGVLPEPQPMDDQQFAAAVKQAIDDAVDYIDGFVSRQRANATAYYRGDFFGNEEPGRSQIVMTEVRDTVLQMMPSLLRIFCGSDEVASFEPRGADKVEQAEQQTDAVNYVFYNDNDGFTILYNAMKDALTRKSGVLKWRHDCDVEIQEYDFTDLSDAQLQLLQQDEDVEILEQESEPMRGWQPPIDPQTGQPVPMQQPMEHDVRLRRHKRKDRILVECVPPEELLVARDGRDLYTSRLVAHRSIKTYSELAAMGFDPQTFPAVVTGLGDQFMWNIEAQTRNPALNAFNQQPMSNDDTATKVVFVEAYVRIDKDGDGVAELRRVCMVGQGVLSDEIWDQVPMAVLCPDPEPHMIIGSSVADQTMDLQLLKSNVVRNTLDSLAQAIHPRTAVVEGQCNMDDVLNVETGAIIRMRAPGMVQPFSEPFVGQAAMPIIQWLDQVKQMRTGVVPQMAGLDADVLQSTTKTAVDATVQGAQERTEMIARIFAEGAIKPMMKGINRLMCKHMDRPRMMRLRGKWVEIDPRVWDADADVIVHVALGRGTTQDQLLALNGIATKQEAAIQMAGLMNPLSDLSNLRNTYAKMTELLGYKNVDQFFKPIDMQAVAQQQAQQSQQQKPDPNMVVAQAQQQKVQGELQIKQMQMQLDQAKAQLDAQQAQADAQLKLQQQQIDAQLKREEMALKDQRERDQARLDAVLRLQGLELQYGTAVTSSDAELELQRARLMTEVIKHRDTLSEDRRQHAVDTAADLHKHAMTVDQKDRADARSQTNGNAA